MIARQRLAAKVVGKKGEYNSSGSTWLAQAFRSRRWIDYLPEKKRSAMIRGGGFLCHWAIPSSGGILIRFDS